MTDWVDPDAMLAYLYGEGAYGDINAPAFDDSMIGNLYGITPQYDFEGDPISASTQSSIWNRWRTSLFDPMFAGMGGDQAYAAGTFDPSISYEMVDSPALTALNMYRRNPQGSIEGMVLEELERGGTPATAFSYLRNLATQETPLGEMVRSQLLPSTSPDGGIIEGEFDWGDVMGRISTVQQQMMEAPQVGPVGAIYNEAGQQIQAGGENVVQYDQNGNPIIVRQITTPSPLAEKFAELGLSPPGQQYQASDFYTPEMLQAMEQYAAMGPALDATREQYLHPPGPAAPPQREDARVMYQQMLEAANAVQGEQPEGPQGPRRLLGFNVPFTGATRQGVPMPGAPGAVTSMATLGESVPWAIDVTANQMVPGGELHTDALGAVAEAGAGNDVLRNITSAANSPAGTIWGGIQSGWNWLVPGEEEPPPESTAQSGGGGHMVQLQNRALLDAMLGLKTPESASKMFAYPTSRPGSEEPPPPGTTVPPTAQEQSMSDDELADWMGSLVSSGTTREGAINYAVANGVDAATAGRVYDQMVPQDRGAPPSASELPNFSPTPYEPPSPAATWPPSLLYDPWAPQQGTAATMAGNLNRAEPMTSVPQSETAPWRPQQPLSATGQLVFNQNTGLWENAEEQWQPPQDNWLGINWGGQQPPPAPGPLPEPRDERTRMEQPTHFNVQLPPGSAQAPPQPPPLTGLEPGEVTPGHYIVQLTQDAVDEAARRSQARPQRHPEAPYGGSDYEAMLNFMMSQSAQGQNVAAPEQYAPPPSQQVEAREAGQREQPQQQQQEQPRLRGRQWEQPTEERRRAAAAFRDVYMARFNAMQQAYGPEFGTALGMARAAQNAGVTPFQQQVMARRMAIMASGMPTGNYLPGT